jgi:dolichol-phosphate mannosyltransferase
VPSHVWLVLPTYNESENLEAIVEAVTAQLDQAAAGDWHLLIVDDNSPDGTGDIGDRLAASSEGRIEVLHRAGKEGLGRAYVAGFKHALAGGAEKVIQMDADFSHDPADIPRLLEAADNADLVIGSRYVSGGVVRDWGTTRRILSRGGCRYASTILGIQVDDLTGGFKCLRRRTLELVDLDSVKAEGYVFQIEVTYRALLHGLKVVEVPITFRDRLAGTSKMSSRIAIEAMWAVLALRRRAESEAGPRVKSN